MERKRYPHPYVDHRIVTLHGVEESRLNDLAFFVRTFDEMMRDDLKVEVVGELRVHQFTPSEQGSGNGISGVGIIGASHEAIHSWSEMFHLRANFEFCSKQAELEQLDEIMLARFNPAAMETERNVLFENGTDFIRRAAYSRSLRRTEGGLLIYDALATESRGMPETARMLRQLQHPSLDIAEVPRVISHHTFFVEIAKAA